MQYFESQRITLQDQQGKQVLIDEALDEALRCESSETRTVLTVLLVVGLLVAAGIAGAIYLMAANG